MKIKSVSVLAVFLLSACNIYSPFAQKSSTLDYVEEGEKCLNNNDYGCAVTAYSAIPDPETRYFKLCSVYLAQGGLTLDMLINTVSSQSATMLGALAQGFVPWTQSKSDALDNAKTNCASYASSASTTVGMNTATLLQSLGYLAHCAIRIAKTDVFLGSSNADTTCNTPGPNTGQITQSDVCDSASGSIASTGMCAADVDTCTVDLSSINNSALSGSGATNISSAVNQVPAALRTSGTATIAARSAIRSAI